MTFDPKLVPALITLLNYNQWGVALHHIFTHDHVQLTVQEQNFSLEHTHAVAQAH